MILKVPSYYEKFHCIADQCKDNCCYGWEIDIDEGTMDYYRSLGGELGKEITSHIREGEENTMIMREDGYCPFLNEKSSATSAFILTRRQPPRSTPSSHALPWSMRTSGRRS